MQSAWLILLALHLPEAWSDQACHHDADEDVCAQTSLLQTALKLGASSNEALREKLLVTAKSAELAHAHSMATSASKQHSHAFVPGELLQTVQKLWKARDLTTSEYAALSHALTSSNLSNPKQLHLSVSNLSNSKQLHLLAPPDSGSNLMVASLQLNWPEHVPGSIGPLDTVLWKHSLSDAKDLFEHLRTCNDQLCTMKGESNMSNAVILVMVRSPISQMVSWHQNPYSLEPCYARDWSEADEPCWANTSPLCHDATDCGTAMYHEGRSTNFSGSVDVYNRYMQQYKDLQSLAGIGGVLLVAYEDLVLTPEKELLRIADAMDWAIPEEIRLVEADQGPASKGPAPTAHTHDQAVMSLERREWLGELEPSGQEADNKIRKLLCSELDITLITDLSEGSHTAEPTPYTHDCDF
jgi:hypothetical protein